MERAVRQAERDIPPTKARAARLEAPRDVVQRCKVVLTRGEGGTIHLILPAVDAK